ncbi:MAG: GspH/FimT family pseudopilin [Acidiferrobacterales bacterium]
MKSAAKFGAEMRQAGGISMPFIGLNIPFVCRPQPCVRPLIDHNKPFVKNRVFSGFTLIELITTLVIAAILMAMAAPSFTSFIKNNRLVSQTNELLADLAFARSEGVKRAANITVCKSTDGLTCNAGADWNDGWITVTAGGQVLRAHEALNDENTMVGTGDVANQIVYDRTGRANNLLAAAEFRVCDYRGAAKGRLIQIAVTGRARVAIDPATSHPIPPAGC